MRLPGLMNQLKVVVREKSVSWFFGPAPLRHPWALPCFTTFFCLNLVQKVRGWIGQWMRIEIPFFAPSQMVKLLERTKKDMDRTRALAGSPYQLVSLSRLCFAMQLFHEKVADTLSDSLGRTIPAVFPLLSPGVRRQVMEVREQGGQVCFRCAIGKKTLHLVVKRCQGQVGNATSINHYQCVGTGKVFWPSYRTKLLRLFHLSHSFSVTTECAVAESPSVAKSTTLSDNPNYILVTPIGFEGHLLLLML